MGRPFLSDDHLGSMAALLLGDLLCFFTFLGSHPVYLAYLLFFSPYLLVALSFLAPLLFSTCFLLLTLLTVSPSFMGSPPPPPPPSDGGGRSSPARFDGTLRLLLDILDPGEGGDHTEVPPPWPLSGIASELQACVESVEEMYRETGGGITAGDDLQANPGGDHEEEEEIEEKRIIAESVSGNEVFGWEMEAIGKLYKTLTCEAEEFPVKLSSAPSSFREGGHRLPPAAGSHAATGETGEDLPRREALSRLVRQSRDRKMPTFERGDAEILLENASNAGDLKSRDRRRPVSGAAPAGCVTGDGAPAVPKRSTAVPKSKAASRPDSDGFKLLRRSSSTSAAAFGVPGSGLSRVASSGEWRWGGGSGPPPLSSSGSMGKEKEWRRTLACKLYEERMVADGGEEGMDLLWETDEGRSGSGDGKRGKGTHGDETKVAGNNGEHGGSEGEEEEEEGEEEMVGKLCCLQALRFSTAKMGFGMGRSGLLKASRAMKGVGAFRRALRSSRNGREKRAEG